VVAVVVAVVIRAQVAKVVVVMAVGGVLEFLRLAQ
jgi:hypothetical protein